MVGLLSASSCSPVATDSCAADVCTCITGFPGVVGCVSERDINFTKTSPEGTYRTKRHRINTMLTVASNGKIIHYSVGSDDSYFGAKEFSRSGLPPLLETLPPELHILG